jgi:hypothetical protein
MKFTPVQAACIFGAAMALPTIPFVLLFAGRAPRAAAIALGALVVSAILFWMGARLAKRPHTVKSLILAILGTWSFSYATAGLAKDFFPAATDYHIVAVLEAAFVFLIAWRLAPKAPAEVQA